MAQTKNVTLTLSGGFHNVNPIRVRIPRQAWKLVVSGVINLSDALTPSQDCRLTRHFCGVEGCLCGGCNHYSVEITED